MKSVFLQLKRKYIKECGLALVVIVFGGVLKTDVAAGQSGRRAAKPSASPSAPAPAEKETPTPEPEKPLGQLPVKVRLLVARQPTSRRLHTEDQIFASFVKHLNRYENIEAASIGDTKEEEATKRAKAETEAFVVLMKFDIDSFQSGTIIMNSQDLHVEYSVLAPISGKRQTKGKVYFQGIGGGRLRKDGWPNGTPIRITPEAAGIEAADGLYFWLKLVAVKEARQ